MYGLSRCRECLGQHDVHVRGRIDDSSCGGCIGMCCSIRVCGWRCDIGRLLQGDLRCLLWQLRRCDRRGVRCCRYAPDRVNQRCLLGRYHIHGRPLLRCQQVAQWRCPVLERRVHLLELLPACWYDRCFVLRGQRVHVCERSRGHGCWLRGARAGHMRFMRLWLLSGQRRMQCVHRMRHTWYLHSYGLQCSR